MNKDEAVQFLPLVQALADGKTIQVNDGTSNLPRWVDIDDPSFTYRPDLYRIKPEPRERDVCEWDVWVCGKYIVEMDMSEYEGWQKTRVREIID